MKSSLLSATYQANRQQSIDEEFTAERDYQAFVPGVVLGNGTFIGNEEFVKEAFDEGAKGGQ